MSLKKVQNSHFAECRSNECCALDKSLCDKGQLISKGHFVSFNSPKKWTKLICPSRLGQKFESSSSFFGRIGDTKDIFKLTDLYILLITIFVVSDPPPTSTC